MHAAESRSIRAASTLAFALAFTMPAAASEQWVPVERTAEGVLQLDAARILRVLPGENFLEVRTRTMLARPAPSGAVASVARVVVHCERHTSRTLSTEWVDAQGRALAPAAQTITPQQAIAAMRDERLEYSARLAPLCSVIATQVARGGVLEPQPPAPPPAAPVVVRLHALEGPARWLPARVNDSVNVDLAVDPSAAATTMPSQVIDQLRRGGSLAAADVLGRRRVAGLPGTVTVVRLKSLRIGSHAIEDVEVAVVEQSVTGVLGQDVLKRLGRWSLNRARGTFEFVPAPAGASAS